MKKSFLLIVLSIVFIGIFLNVVNISPVGADSGFDSSYDSGGSDWDSGSSWDSDSGGGGDSDPAMILMFPYIIWGIAGLIINSNNFDNKKKSKLKSVLFLIFYILSMLGIIYLEWILIEDKIEAISVFVFENIFISPIVLGALSSNKNKPKQKIIEGIDNEKIVNDSFENYKELQISWMNFDYDKIKELVSDEMYNMYMNQLETLKIKNQQNIMNDIEFIEGYITDYKKVNNRETFKIYLSVSCYDYIINTKNNMTVRGNKNRKLTLTYILTFERNVETTKYCPQCGADVENLTECKYCKSKIVNNNDKLKMTKKQIVSQK